MACIIDNPKTRLQIFSKNQSEGKSNTLLFITWKLYSDYVIRHCHVRHFNSWRTRQMKLPKVDFSKVHCSSYPVENSNFVKRCLIEWSLRNVWRNCKICSQCKLQMRVVLTWCRNPDGHYPWPRKWVILTTIIIKFDDKKRVVRANIHLDYDVMVGWMSSRLSNTLFSTLQHRSQQFTYKVNKLRCEYCIHCLPGRAPLTTIKYCEAF